MKGYIYKYTFPNGKVYIGQTRTSVEQRHNQHMWASNDIKRMSLCERAIAKYGEPQIEVIEIIEVDDRKPTEFSKKLNEAEKKWIKHYNSTDSFRGYNVQCGGQEKTSEQFILEEKWYEIYEKEGWEASVAYIHDALDKIGTKLFNTKEKLTKEEKYIWYGYPFRIINVLSLTHCQYGIVYKKMTFNGFWKSTFDNEHPNEVIDYGDFPYECYGTDGKLIECMETYTQIMRQAFDYMLMDIQQTIWEKIMRKKEKIIKDWYRC